MAAPVYKTADELIGNTPLVRLQRLPVGDTNTILVKLEGMQLTCSVKARAAFNMIKEAERKKRISPGDTLIEATSGNTGIALSAAAAILGYKMVVVMSENATEERKQIMAAYGAELKLMPASAGTAEDFRAMVLEMEKRGEGIVLNQFRNEDNPDAHYKSTGPEIWRDTNGTVTHFVSAMGTSGTMMGTTRFLKEKNPEIQAFGVLPEEGSKIPGIRKWADDFVPTFCNFDVIDEVLTVNQEDANEMARRVAREEGIFVGISSAGALLSALRLSQREDVKNATIVVPLADWGDRYLSSGVFQVPHKDD